MPSLPASVRMASTHTTVLPDMPTSQSPSRPRPRWRRPRPNGTNSPAQQIVQGNGTAAQTPNPDTLPNTPARNSSLAFRPVSVAPESSSPSAEPSSAETSAAENAVPSALNTRGGRGSGKGGTQALHLNGVQSIPRHTNNGRGARATNHRGTTVAAGRQFGGRLTTKPEAQLIPLPTSTLQADAPEFQPGRPHVQRREAGVQKARGPPRQAQGKVARLRRGSSLKSTAPDIATRTHEDITNGVYECPICTSEVARNSRVWSCKTCWTVFHLTCIKKWSTNEGSTLTRQQTQDGDFPPPRQWRCPGCNLPKDVLPSSYTCWCGKETDPGPIAGLPPHSCGQTCGKARLAPKKCPHPCDLLCHAGPCPPCTHVGPVQSCFCGKVATSRRCIDTKYDSGWSCGEVCGDAMPCGEHTCPQSCHEGLCGACETEVDARCYCGKEQHSILCCDRGDQKQSTRAPTQDGLNDVEFWLGSFECGSICNRTFGCGKHQCERQCHPQDLKTSHCPRSPDLIISCPCGKTSLTEIRDTPRQSCDDPIPNCSKKCLKTLFCGHACQQICHADACMPCLQTMTISCRCGRVSSATVCHQGNQEPPQCTRSCKAVMNCGRHECGERCCPGERKAAERQATKRKLRPLGAAPRMLDEGFEAEHICTRLCGRLLKCGNHSCPELCHKGACGSCREAIFDEISCHCGRTMLQPPLPCGTIAPACRYDCERLTTCGHPKVAHNCHGDDEKCPKCPFLKEKPCMCGKKSLKNQPCWLADVRCGEICRRMLKCGSHFCRKPCHRAGECEDAAQYCQQACGKAKKACGHPCEEPCHAPSSCREDKPCPNKMFATCNCQHLKQEMKCNASKTSEGNSKKTLACDDECARLARNRKLALALNIDPETHKDDHVPYSTDTLNIFREHIKWAQVQEREFRVFAGDENEKRLRFKPMLPHQRAFLHSLAEDFGLDSESMDPEPHRHVAIFKTPRFVMAPMKTLAECVRIRATAEAASTTVAEAQKKLRTTNEPFNGYLLSNPRFGLTLEELRAEFGIAFASVPSLDFDISFLPSEEIVIKARPVSLSTSVEPNLKALKSSLSSTITSKHLATSLQLCSLDSSLNILRRELDDAAANSGWSQVAAKAAAPRSAPRTVAVGEKSVYTVLGSKLKDAKKKKEGKKKEVVVEDWEEEVRREEAEEGFGVDEQPRTGVVEADLNVENGHGDQEPDTAVVEAQQLEPEKLVLVEDAEATTFTPPAEDKSTANTFPNTASEALTPTDEPHDVIDKTTFQAEE